MSTLENEFTVAIDFAINLLFHPSSLVSAPSFCNTFCLFVNY